MKAEDATPPLDRRSQHRRAAAPLTFDCHVPPPIVVDYGDTKRRVERIKNNVGLQQLDA
jgi:hypothetical protein